MIDERVVAALEERLRLAEARIEVLDDCCFALAGVVVEIIDLVQADKKEKVSKKFEDVIVAAQQLNELRGIK